MVLDGEGLEAGISILGGTSGVTIQTSPTASMPCTATQAPAPAPTSRSRTKTLINNSYGIRAGNDTGGEGALEWTVADNELVGNHYAIELDNAVHTTLRATTFRAAHTAS